MAEEKIIRPNWDEYFLGLIEPIGKRATCGRGRSGAVIVSPHRTILATGYVGAPPGQPHCDEVGHMMRTVIDEAGNQSQHCVRTLHAEENAILQCAKDGIKIEGATLYCKMVPCYNCAMRIVRVGVKKVVAQKRYHADGLSVKLFNDANVELIIIENTTEEYKNQ
ncbi:MAG: cell division protein DedD [Candidatus Nealsonbacteria bacterium RIFCSPLOWO2_01_FULL_43_32]|uniref:Cell division protein DedD n=1 Tax=Candidatus Nealsonbacteria bacterium RIFCSPLOWO2_01_FULL_43_32 TaxID=1801672 RepID=A0A1G2EG29_9BACT|nr:MAG: cell division protein DedD [Candidatus Nealsonbacteria bacterium RIFCSPLOWO2_01_FULL_43_32]